MVRTYSHSFHDAAFIAHENERGGPVRYDAEKCHGGQRRQVMRRTEVLTLLARLELHLLRGEWEAAVGVVHGAERDFVAETNWALLPLEDLDLPAEARRKLQRKNIGTVAELIAMSKAQLRSEGFEKKYVDAIDRAVRDVGLRLKS